MTKIICPTCGEEIEIEDEVVSIPTVITDADVIEGITTVGQTWTSDGYMVIIDGLPCTVSIN